MPLTAGHYNVVLKGRFDLSQDVINSFYFNLDMDGGTLVGDDAELFSLAKHFWDNIKAQLRAVTASVIKYTSLDVFKADGSDVGNSGFYTIPLDEQAGLDTADPLPPFVTWTFQYTRPSAIYRHGWKRFAGVTEGNQSKGVPSGLGIAALDALAAKLDDDVKLNDALINAPFIEPALVQRVRNGVAVDPDVWYKPSTVQFKKVGSQNTRKYGVGS